VECWAYFAKADREMSINRTAKRIDANQPAIVDALERIGASVYILSKPLDLLVGYQGRNWLVEIKDGSKPPSARHLTPAQIDFCATWRGQWALVKDVAEAIDLVRRVSPPVAA
jgi:hypothetical protein